MSKYSSPADKPRVFMGPKESRERLLAEDSDMLNEFGDFNDTINDMKAEAEDGVHNDNESAKKAQPQVGGRVFMGPKESREHILVTEPKAFEQETFESSTRSRVFRGTKDTEEDLVSDDKIHLIQKVTPKQEHFEGARVFMGPSNSRESPLDSLQVHSMAEWRKRVEAEYLEQIKERIVERTKKILQDATEEAKVLKEAALEGIAKQEEELDNAHHELEAQRLEVSKEQAELAALREEVQRQYDTAAQNGYQQGVEQAMLEMQARQEELESHFEQHRFDLDHAYVSVLRAIEEQADHIFATWRQDMVRLLLDSVQVGIGFALEKDRQKSLTALFDNAVQQLTEHKRLTIHVHPDDIQLVQEVANSAKARFPDLRTWDVEAKQDMVPGSLAVESDVGRADNNMDYRLQQLYETLQHLELPQGEAEEKAKEAIAKADSDNGIDKLAENVNARLEARQAEEARFAEEARQAEEAEQARLDEEAELARQAEEARLTEEALAQEQAYQEEVHVEQGEIVQDEAAQDEIAQDGLDQDEFADFSEFIPPPPSIHAELPEHIEAHQDFASQEPTGQEPIGQDFVGQEYTGQEDFVEQAEDPPSSEEGEHHGP